jgi:hypothetical protein
VDRARYQPELARRTFSPRRSASLEAEWNSTLRARSEAEQNYDRQRHMLHVLLKSPQRRAEPFASAKSRRSFSAACGVAAARTWISCHHNDVLMPSIVITQINQETSASKMETMIASVRISPQQVGQRAEITTTTIRMRSHVEMNMHGTRGLTHDLTHPSSVAAGNQIGAVQLNLKQPSRTDSTATGATLARDVPGAPGR